MTPRDTAADPVGGNVLVRWWRRRTLRARLSLLVTGAVAVAVLALAALAFTAVASIQHRQLSSQLRSDAHTAAERANRYPTRVVAPPDGGGDGDDDGQWRRDLGPLLQTLATDGTVVRQSGSALPVTGAAKQVAAGSRESAEEQVTVGGEGYLMLTVPVEHGPGAVQVAVSEEPATRTLTIFGVLLGVACLLGVAVAALLGRAVARAGLVPVQRLTEAVEQVATTMDLTHPVPVHGVDEIARLGGSVNTMLAAIDTARRAQRALVEDAGHELRTPLTSIRTNIELLLAVERHPELAHRLPPEERAKLLRDLEAQVGELATLTTELVELAREETTREESEPVDLSDVVDAAIDRVRIRAPGVGFVTDLSPCTVRGRPGELERMVVNVLDNAAKWSPPCATVHAVLRTDGPDGCELTVTDTGPGIDEADRPYVFDRFYRAPAARGMPGSGLGLAIVAQTANQHGGTVAVGPNQPHGTVVTIHLPCRPAPVPVSPAPAGGRATRTGWVRRANRTAVGSLAGQVDLSGDWDSAQTNAEIAADFGMDE